MKYIFLIFTTATLLACGGANDAHQGHNHETEEHNHESEDEGHEGHDHGADDKKNDKGAQSSEHNHEGGITLSVEQALALGLTYEKIVAEPFAAAVQVSGIIEPATNDNSTVIANVSGIVKITQNGLNIGSKVDYGKKIFAIEAGNLVDNNVENKVAIAKTALGKAQTDYNRVIELSKDAIVTQEQVEQAKLDLQTAKKNYEALSKSQVINAPLGGYITSLEVKNGDFVNEGQTLATISSGKNLVVKADLPSRYFNILTKIQSANFITPYNKEIYTLKELNGKLLSKGNSIKNGSYTVPILFSIENRANLIAGTAIEVFLITAEQSNVMSVPTSALTEEQGAFYVYIRTCVDSYEKILVKIGENNGKRTEILNGLHEGDNVVASGAYFVRLASASNAIPHGHSH